MYLGQFWMTVNSIECRREKKKNSERKFEILFIFRASFDDLYFVTNFDNIHNTSPQSHVLISTKTGIFLCILVEVTTMGNTKSKRLLPGLSDKYSNSVSRSQTKENLSSAILKCFNVISKPKWSTELELVILASIRQSAIFPILNHARSNKLNCYRVEHESSQSGVDRMVK